VFFTMFLGIYVGNSASGLLTLFNIPVAIILGILTGIVLGFFMLWIYRKLDIRATKKVLLLLGFSILLTEFEKIIRITTKWEVATLLGIMTAGFIILEKNEKAAEEIASKLNKIWIFAEILLFVLIGAQVNVGVGLSAGFKGLLIIAIGLIARSTGVIISTIGSGLNFKEKIFCCFSYIPKATVQAAVGAIPLAAGVASGEIILAIAVLSIIITAPLGSFLIKNSAKRLLE
ncbi:MAG: cation:proton antiporter, partial [Candidatus Muiribacteriota bacterium]